MQFQRGTKGDCWCRAERGGTTEEQTVSQLYPPSLRGPSAHTYTQSRTAVFTLTFSHFQTLAAQFPTLMLKFKISPRPQNSNVLPSCRPPSPVCCAPRELNTAWETFIQTHIEVSHPSLSCLLSSFYLIVSVSHIPPQLQFWESKWTELHCVLVSAEFGLAKVGRAFLTTLLLCTTTCMKIHPRCTSLGLSGVENSCRSLYNKILWTVYVLLLLASSNISPHCYAFVQMYQLAARLTSGGLRLPLSHHSLTFADSATTKYQTGWTEGIQLRQFKQHPHYHSRSPDVRKPHQTAMKGLLMTHWG